MNVRAASQACVAGLALVFCSVVSASTLDDLGFTALRALHPELTGAGQTVAQPEALPVNSSAYQVNPVVGQSAGIFHYYDSTHAYGTAGASFSSGLESGHADTVGSHLYGTTGGGAPGVQSVENFEANYFISNIIGTFTPISSPIVNQSFIVDTSDATTIALYNRYYDAYANTYGTLFINGLNNGSGSLTNAPASMYNGIAVGQSDGTHSGRAQIVAPGGQTSFATPYVTAAAVVLRQAAAAGYFQALIGTNATDARVLKAGLLNGAVKTAGWTHTSTDPLDATSGAGVVNVKNSFDMLAGGQHTRSVSNQTTRATGSVSLTTPFSSAITALNGWNLASLTATNTKDAVHHYFFDLSSEISLDLTATLTWNSLVNLSLGTDKISDFDLVLVDVTSQSIVWSSVSTDKNVEHIYLTNLAGSKYDLQVILRGGASAPTLTDTYAVVWSWKSNPATAVPESDYVWLIGFAGLVFAAGRHLSLRRRRGTV